LAAIAAGCIELHAAWFKGNTHAHTLMSDGNTSPEDLARWYRQHGYDFLFITDHNGVTNVAPVNEALGNGGKFLVIAGQEVTSTMPGGAAVHVNALRPQRSLKEQLGNTAAETLQKDIQTILDAGGMAQINHPNFRWGLNANDIAAAKGAALLEFFNAGGGVNTYGAGPGFPGTEEIWDLVLSRGVLIWGVASDDSHDLIKPGRGWIVVRAARLAPDDLLDAMARGDFYASTGVEIRDYSADASQISVAVVQKGDEKYRIQFVGPGGVLQDQTGAAAVYRIRGNEGYVRARITDSNGQTAWMQPVMPGKVAPSRPGSAAAAPAGAEPRIVPGPPPPVVLGAGGVPIPIAPAPLPPATLPPATSRSPARVNPPLAAPRPVNPPPAPAPTPTRIRESPAPVPSAAGPAPKPANPRDIAIAALAAAASGNLPQARAAFNASNFPQEKQEDLVREAYIEVQLQSLLALAADRQCGPADQGLTTLGYDDKSLPFTFNGFGAFMKTLRFQYRTGLVEAACGDAKTARRIFERLSRARPEISSPDYAYPSMALSKVSPAEGTAKAKAALDEVGRSLAKADTALRPTLLYSQGLLQMALSRTQEAAASFREGAGVSPPGMLHYLNLDALRAMDSQRR
jgi:hypothetical protein